MDGVEQGRLAGLVVVTSMMLTPLFKATSNQCSKHLKLNRYFLGSSGRLKGENTSILSLKAGRVSAPFMLISTAETRFRPLEINKSGEKRPVCAIVCHSRRSA
jgi:hypothetical protein